MYNDTFNLLLVPSFTCLIFFHIFLFCNTRKHCACCTCTYVDDVVKLLRRPGSSRYRVLPAIAPHDVPDTGQPAAESKYLPESDILSRSVRHFTSNDAMLVADRGRQSTQASVNEMPKSLSSHDSADGDRFWSNDYRNTSNECCSTIRPQRYTESGSSESCGRHGSGSESSAVVDCRQSTESSQQASPASSLAHGELIQLAIKFPSGKRAEGRFRPTHMLAAVMRFAESVAERNFADCEFVCAEPRSVFGDLRATIRSCGIANRSVLYIQLPAPDAVWLDAQRNIVMI